MAVGFVKSQQSMKLNIEIEGEELRTVVGSAAESVNTQKGESTLLDALK